MSLSPSPVLPFTPTNLETRLTDLGIPIARLIEAAQIRRATWRDWRAGRTRPRPDRWAVVTAAFDALVAEASPPPAEVEPEAPAVGPVPLIGSSAPTGAPPSFAPVATAAPAGAASDDIDALIAGVLPPGDVVSQSDRARVLIERDRAAWGALCDQPTTDPRFDQAARLDDARDLAVGNLTATPARTSHELAAKASVILAGLGDKPAGWLAEITPFVDLVQSTAADAVRLGVAHQRAPTGAAAEACGGALSADTARNFATLADLLEEMDGWCRLSGDCSYRTVWPPVPEAMFRRAEDGLWAADKVVMHQCGRRWYPPEVMDDLRRMTFDRALLDPSDCYRRRRDEVVAAFDRWQMAREAACIVSGLAEAAAAATACGQRIAALRDAILDRPAADFGDVLAKTAVVCWWYVDMGEDAAATFAAERAEMVAQGNGSTEIAMTRAILSDLATMAAAQGLTLDRSGSPAGAGAAEGPIAATAA